MKTECSVEEIRQVQINILNELSRVCEENGLTYYLAFGTCLGAVRHHGFIPWDDDLDVAMKIEDIERLITLKDQFLEGFFLQCTQTEPKYGSALVRLRDSRTTCIEEYEAGQDINHGFFVDIYPLYYYPENPLVAHYNIIVSFLYRILIVGREPYNHGKLVNFFGKVLLKCYTGEHRKKKIQKLYHQLTKFRNTSAVLTYYGYDISLTKAITYPVEYFGKPSKLEFEGQLYNAPTEPEKFLTRRYGDFMKLPPIEQQHPTHSFIFADVHKSYKEYMDYDFLKDQKKGDGSV